MSRHARPCWWAAACARIVGDSMIPNRYRETDELLWLALRVIAGGFLVPHGMQKLFNVLGSPGIETLTRLFESKARLSPGAPFVYLTGLVELAGGLMLACGLLTRAAALSCTLLLLAAVVLVNAFGGFFWTAGGLEYPLMWALVCACFVIRGGGPYALDECFIRSQARGAD